jgi:hypothetical protein
MKPVVVEEKVRQRLTEIYHTPLQKVKLEIKDGLLAEFDFASKDQRIIGQIKTSRPSRVGKQKGKVRIAQVGDLSRDCLLLAAKKNAKTRLLVLTNGKVFDTFRISKWGKAAEALGIRIRLEQVRCGSVHES